MALGLEPPFRSKKWANLFPENASARYEMTSNFLVGVRQSGVFDMVLQCSATSNPTNAK